MSRTGDLAAAYWSTLEARDWTGFAATLALDVVATWPQTRERCDGREALLDFMRTFPGDWHLEMTDVVADAGRAATRVAATLDGVPMEAVTFFGFRDDVVVSIVEYWPEAYDPPVRGTVPERY